MYLAQGHNTATSVRIEPSPLALESEALELDHRDSLFFLFFFVFVFFVLFFFIG